MGSKLIRNQQMGLQNTHIQMEITGLSRWSEMWSLMMLDFSYDGKKQILHGINLYADKDKSGLCPELLGAGKTTITNLINRFYDIQSGMITYDGIDIKLIEKDSLRRSLPESFFKIPTYSLVRLRKTSLMAVLMQHGKKSWKQLGLPMDSLC